MAKDVMHTAARHALENDGWTITHDPLQVPRGTQLLFIDLGAEMPLAAEREGRKIAVEVKSLVGGKEMPEFERALGQYFLYRNLLKYLDPERTVYLAVANNAYNAHFDSLEGMRFINDDQIRLIVFNEKTETILKWIEPPITSL